MRGLLVGVGVFWLGMLSMVSVLAAPISGSFQVDFVVHSVTCGVDEDADTFVDEDLSNGIDDDGDSRVDEDGCLKVDDTVMKFEADLLLQFTVSGLQISSTTVFTFKGLEYQAFTLSTTIGALSIKDIFIFSPSVVEIEFVRTNLTLTLRYCVNTAAPNSLSAIFYDCPTPDSLLYWLIEDGIRFHPAAANLRLAQIFDGAEMLDDSLVFRKKIVDLSLNVAGLTFSSRALFVNVGTVGTPSFRVGSIAAIEGQTVSGILVRAETWIGAREGLECFGECKPLERIYGGVVVTDFSPQEEKILIRNLALAGVTTNLGIGFQLHNNPNAPDCVTAGLCYVQVDTRAKLQPLNLTLRNELRLGHDLNPRFDLIQTELRSGDISVTILWYFYPSADCGSGVPCPWEAQWVELISTFDPPGFTVTSDLSICTATLLVASCSFTNGAMEHDIYLSAFVGSFTVNAKVIFLGLISGFSQLWVDIAWRGGAITITGSSVSATDAIEALGLRIEGRF